MRMPLHRSSTVNKVSTCHCFRSSSSLWVILSRGLFTIKEDAMYSTCKLVSLESRCSSNYYNFPFWLRWSVFKVLQSPPARWRNSVLGISYALLCICRVLFLWTQQESKYKEKASLLKSSRLLFSHQFQIQAVPPGNAMSTIHIILCFCCLSAICKQLQLNQLTAWLCYQQCLLSNP